jgi:Protein of unknown function (DUF2829)
MTQEYFGTKRVTAWPEAKQIRLPDEHGNVFPMEDGYAVKYSDGYTSWSPKDVFEAAYQPLDALSFGHAIVALKAGHKVARAGWNGNGMFLFLVPGSRFKVNRPPLLGIYEEGTKIDYRPHIDIKTADGSVSTWAPSIGDALADDWTIVT